MATRLTLNVTGSLGLDDDRRLIAELERATGLEWRSEPVADDGHLTGGLVEIVLVAVLGKSTELAYGAVVDKARDRIEKWRRERLDKPSYTLSGAPAAEAAEDAGAAQDGADGGTRASDAPESAG